MSNCLGDMVTWWHCESKGGIQCCRSMPNELFHSIWVTKIFMRGIETFKSKQMWMQLDVTCAGVTRLTATGLPRVFHRVKITMIWFVATRWELTRRRNRIRNIILLRDTLINWSQGLYIYISSLELVYIYIYIYIYKPIRAMRNETETVRPTDKYSLLSRSQE